MSTTEDNTPQTIVFDRASRDAIRKRFEEAWHRGERPMIENYLPKDPVARHAVLLDLIPVDLEHRLQGGDAVVVEHYLHRFAELAQQPKELLALIGAEYALRQRHANVLPEEYLQRFPQFGSELKEYLQSHYSTLSCKPPHPGRLPPASLPERFGRYRILSLLGHGGMGSVYRAHDTHLDRTVALKVPRLKGGRVATGKQFLREARAAAHLHHPNICPVYDAGKIEGIPYLTMACIEGQPLTRALPPPLPLPQAASLVRTLAQALQEAHSQQVIHRDLKPGNILINPRGEPVITDFGLARRVRPTEVRQTRQGQVMGTPAYMPPEQACGDIDAMGPSCDIYSLGVILYELLTQQLPFQGKVGEVLTKILTQEPTPPSRWRADLAPRLEAICLQAIAKRSQDRFPSMAAFADALTEWLETVPGTSCSPKPRQTPVTAPLDPRAAEDILRVLRTWGWEMGLARLKASLSSKVGHAELPAAQISLGWLAGERGHHEVALEQFQAVESSPGLASWALTGRAFVALRERDYPTAHECLNRAAAGADAQDTILRATIAHLRGTIACHEGLPKKALAELHAALEQFGPSHFGSGRVLDTLGMVHAARGNLLLAVEFFTQALEVKQRFGDEAGISLTHGQLGRLYIDWGQHDLAMEHLGKGLTIARQIGDERGEAQLYNHRGQVLLACGRSEEAVTLLSESIRSAWGRWPVLEGYARKDLALAHLALGKLEEADREIDQTESLFQAAGFIEGTAHVGRVRGLIRREQQRFDEAIHTQQAAAVQFIKHGVNADAARVHRELAGTLRAQGAAAALVASALLTALEQAELSRHGQLVTTIENELREVSRFEQIWHAYRRLRGPNTTSDRTTSFDGVGEVATVLFLELRPDNMAAAAPVDWLPQRFSLYSDLAEVLQETRVTVCQYCGDGLVALAQGRDHATRVVAASIAVVRALAEFNRPRRVLGWPLWHVHAGISSGGVGIADLGTYQKLDGSVVGSPVQLAIRLCAESEPDLPCISEAVQQMLAARFSLTSETARVLHLKGLGPQRVWDVVGTRQ